MHHDHNIILTIGIFVAILFTTVNIALFSKNQTAPTINFICMAIGWTMFIAAGWIF